MKNAGYGISNFSVSHGIGRIIRDKQAALDKSYKGGRKELVVLIKATSGASYQNVVKLLDEMAIDRVTRYSLITLTDDEKLLLGKKRLTD
jgi:hypothetical protein